MATCNESCAQSFEKLSITNTSEPETAVLDRQEDCAICYSNLVNNSAIIMLLCKHRFHYRCVKTMLEKKWPGNAISFSFVQCPLCKNDIKHPGLSAILKPIYELKSDVLSKCIQRSIIEQLDTSINPLERYYQCLRCRKAYYGGLKSCAMDERRVITAPSNLRCDTCLTINSKTCSKHGSDDMLYKCNNCCSVATFVCFGLHFCTGCHDNPDSLWEFKNLKCPIGPGQVQLTGDCPLNISHPTYQKFAIGCGICKCSEF